MLRADTSEKVPKVSPCMVSDSGLSHFMASSGCRSQPAQIAACWLAAAVGKANKERAPKPSLEMLPVCCSACMPGVHTYGLVARLLYLTKRQHRGPGDKCSDRCYILSETQTFQNQRSVSKFPIQHSRNSTQSGYWEVSAPGPGGASRQDAATLHSHTFHRL